MQGQIKGEWSSKDIHYHFLQSSYWINEETEALISQVIVSK